MEGQSVEAGSCFGQHVSGQVGFFAALVTPTSPATPLPFASTLASALPQLNCPSRAQATGMTLGHIAMHFPVQPDGALPAPALGRACSPLRTPCCARPARSLK